MYGYQSWTIEKAEHWRIDAFELWCWRRLLQVPWTAKRWNQSILKETSPEYSLEGQMLKLKLYFNTLDTWCKSQLIGKDPDAGKDWGQEEKGMTGWDDRGWQRLGGITDSMDMGLGGLQELVMDREAWRAHMGSQRVRHDWVTELNWTELMLCQVLTFSCDSWRLKSNSLSIF